MDCTDATQSSTEETDAILRYLRCAMSYQNQILAEIKTLLETLTLQQSHLPEEK